jgi:hypothetical protein
MARTQQLADEQELGRGKIIADERVEMDIAEPKPCQIAPYWNLRQNSKTLLEVGDSTPNTVGLD